MKIQEKENIITRINKVLKDGGYIKGYGNNCRLMDFKHNPVLNFPKNICKELFDNGVLCQSGLIYKLNLSND